MSAAIDPAQLLAQLHEHPVSLPVTQRLTPACTARTDEERRVRRRSHLLAAQRQVGSQWADRAWVQRYLARLGELGPAYGQDTVLQVHVRIAQIERFGDS